METTKHKSISISWGTDDVLGKAEEMEVEISMEEANEILDIIERQHDATIGINWDVIACNIQDFVDRK